jgi:hypothetical protein
MKNIIKIFAIVLGFSSCFADPELYTYGFYFAVDSRAPTPNEPSLTDRFIYPQVIQTYPGIFAWIDTADNQIYDYVSGPAGSLVWVQRGAPAAQSFIADATGGATTNLPTNFNALTSLLQLSTAMNNTDTAVNDIATKYNDLVAKFNTLEAHLIAQGLMAAS